MRTTTNSSNTVEEFRGPAFESTDLKNGVLEMSRQTWIRGLR